MKRTTPLLLVVAGLSALLLALTMFWLAVLPGQLASALKLEIENRTGLHAKASNSTFSMRNGLSLQLDNVTLTSSDEQSVPTASVDHVKADLSLANLFGGKLRLENIELENPVINIKTEATAPTSTETGSGDGVSHDEKPSKDLAVTLHNGTVKWSDAGRQVSFAVSDLNGNVTTEQDGSAKLDLAGLFNGKLTRLAATVDDIRRLKADGSPSDVTLSAGENSISFSGRTLLRGGMQMDGRISASSDSLRNLASWFGLQFSGFAEAGSLKAESSVSWDGARLDLKQLAINLGQSKISGSASLDLQQSRPTLEATLDADRIDLAIYNKASGASQQSDAPVISQPWNEVPMDFHDLRALNAKVSVNAAKLVVAGLEIGKAALALQLKDYALDLTLSSDDVAGGKANAELQVIQPGKMPEFALKLEIQNVGAKAFLQPLTGFSAVDGAMSLQADLTSQGDSPARLISSLSGTTEFAVKDGSINGLALAGFLSGKGSGWRLKNDATTVLTSGEAKFEIQDGVAQIASLNVETSGMTLAAQGEIDLLRQHLDLICKPEVAGVVKLPVQLSVSGPWTNPDVDTNIDPDKLNPKALLKTGKKAIKKLFGN